MPTTIIGRQFPSQIKIHPLGGRWTRNSLHIPYGCLIPAQIDGLLVCEKISRCLTLPMVPIAAGGHGYWSSSWDGSGAVCDSRLEPSNLPVRNLQLALLQDQRARGIVPLFNLPPTTRLVALAALLPGAPRYITSGNCPCDVDPTPYSQSPLPFSGIFHRRDEHTSPSLIQLTYVQQLGHLSPCDRR